MKNILAECCADVNNEFECTIENLVTRCQKYYEDVAEMFLSPKGCDLQTELRRIAYEYISDPELYFAILSTLHNNVLLKAVDDDTVKYFKLSDRGMELYNAFSHLFKMYSYKSYKSFKVSECTELVKNLTNRTNFNDIIKLHNNTENVDISFTPAIIDENLFHTMYQDYVNTLSDYSNSLAKKLKEQPCYSVFVSNQYLKDATLSPSVKVLFIKANGQFVGFICLVEYPVVNFQNCTFAIEQFYILPEYRGTSIAKRAVKKIFSMYSGKGCLDILTKNIRARKFWNDVLCEHTKCYDAFKESNNEVYCYVFLL